MADLKVALIHDYLTQYGGAERTLEAIHDIFPDSTIFTSIYKPEQLPESFKNWKVKTTSAQNLPLINYLSKHYTFLYPFMFEQLDLREFDVVISDWSAWSKGVITSPRQLHISYCHCPPRFLYKYSGESEKRNRWPYKPFVAYLDNFLRIWDFGSAQRPDYLIANSKTVAERIKKFYGRDAEVVYPPLKLSREMILPEGGHKFDTSYYLIGGRMEAYKRFDAAIKAFNYLGLPLRVFGTGKEEPALNRLAKGNIAFFGRVSDRELSILYQNCRGFINPVVDEDFGITSLEALSYGKPVLVHRSGGFKETIEENKTGMFIDDLSDDSVIQAIQKFELAIKANAFDPGYLKNSVKKYDESIFKEKIKNLVASKWQEKSVIKSAHA